MATKILTAAVTPYDMAALNAVIPPTKGCDAGGGVHVIIPADWQLRIGAGTEVPGCTYVLASAGLSGSLIVVDVHQAKLQDTTAVASLSPLLQKQAALLKIKLGLASVVMGSGANAVSVLLGGQSNGVGQDGSVAGWAGADPNVSFFDFNDSAGGESGTGTPITTLAPRASSLHGCELTLANGLVGAGKTVTFVKDAINGTGINYWLTGAGNAELLDSVDRICYAGNPKLAFVWWQGEQDAGASAATYQSLLASLASMIRSRAGGLISVRMFIVRINSTLAGTQTGFASIRTGQENFVVADANAEILSTDALVFNSGIHAGDGQQLTLGTSFVSQVAAYFP